MAPSRQHVPCASYTTRHARGRTDGWANAEAFAPAGAQDRIGKEDKTESHCRARVFVRRPSKTESVRLKVAINEAPGCVCVCVCVCVICQVNTAEGRITSARGN